MKAIECSAKENENIRDVFRSFLALSKLSFEGDESTAGLKRRSSAHAGSKSPAPQQRSPGGSTSNSPKAMLVPSPPAGSQQHQHHPHFHFGTPPKTPTSPNQLSTYQQFLAEDSAQTNRNKPRSRSLIRRCSKKVKQQVRDASTGPGDCQMS